MTDPFRISERAFQNAVIEIARWGAWQVFHARAAQLPSGRWATPTQGDIGFPDLVLAKRGPKGGIIFAELKTAIGRTSDAQETWLDVLRHAGAEVYVWRPRDIQTIRQRLTEGPLQ